MRRPTRVVIPRFIALLAALGALLLTARSLRGQARTADTAAKPDTTHTQVHFRVIGVFDEETGDPIEGADISDMITGLTVRTTKTGTAPLFFTDNPGTLVTIKKLGYQQALVAVTTTLADSTPLTTTLLRMGHLLTPVIVVGDRPIWLAKTDTISTLMRNGFYERRETGAAPRSAFISGDKMQGSTLTTDARFFGRGICESNVYVDGVHVVVPRRTGRFLKEGIDAIVDPFDIAGIETYTTGEMPIGGGHTVEGAGELDESTASANAVANAAGTLAGSGCVTMIWLKR